MPEKAFVSMLLILVLVFIVIIVVYFLLVVIVRDLIVWRYIAKGPTLCDNHGKVKTASSAITKHKKNKRKRRW